MKKLKTIIIGALACIMALAVFSACGGGNRHREVWRLQMSSWGGGGGSTLLQSNVIIQYSDPVVVAGGDGLTPRQWFDDNIPHRFGTGDAIINPGSTPWEPDYTASLDERGRIDHSLGHAFVAGTRIGYSKMLWDVVQNPTILDQAPSGGSEMRFVFVENRTQWLETRTHTTGGRTMRVALIRNQWREIQERIDLTFMFVTVQRVIRNYLRVTVSSSSVSASFSHTRDTFNFDIGGDVETSMSMRDYDSRGNLRSIIESRSFAMGDNIMSMSFTLQFFDRR